MTTSVHDSGHFLLKIQRCEQVSRILMLEAHNFYLVLVTAL